MLTKLSLTGIKSRRKDYFVLFSGLVIAAAIFYMFQSLATNDSFLASNSLIKASFTKIIFQVGSILLAIITLAYIVYANTFLMQMRQRDYGMFMMLGAKKSKIGQLIFLETLIIGLLATVVGIVIGTGLTSVVGRLLSEQLDMKATHFNPIYVPAILLTVVFFIILFILAAIFNQYSLLKTPVLRLLNNDRQPTRVRKNQVWTGIQVVLGVACLGVGYYFMAHLAEFFPVSLFGALITIILGTYFLFNAFFIWVIQLLKKNQNYAYHGIRNFTLGQLSFRIRDFTKMLSLVTMLFALALGAISVGIGFQNEVQLSTDKTIGYDAILHRPTEASKKLVDELPAGKKVVNYDIKEDGWTTYVVANQLDENPIILPDYAKRTGNQGTQFVQVTGQKIKDNKTDQGTGEISQIIDLLKSGYNQVPDEEAKPNEPAQQQTIKAVSAAEFAAAPGKVSQVTTIRNADFYSHKDVFKQLAANETKAYGIKGTQESGLSPIQNYTKYEMYSMINSVYSGMEFMGFFLGIAFLAMLASCLMFKILSGAANDVKRYNMLDKIGVRRGLLIASIRKEVFVLFALPGILGMVHVLFGLQMFKLMMTNPYSNLWLPFGIFIALYAIYYFATVQLYKGIVLKKPVK